MQQALCIRLIALRQQTHCNYTRIFNMAASDSEEELNLVTENDTSAAPSRGCIRCSCARLPRRYARRVLKFFKRIRSSGSESERGQFKSLRSREREELEGASSGSSPRSSVAGSPHVSRRLDYNLPKSRSQDFPTGPGAVSRSESEAEEWEVHSALWHELVEEHERLKDEFDDTKKTLLRLQDLLLSGEPPDGAESEPSAPVEGVCADEQIVILKSRLQQSDLQCKDLKEELSRVKNECMELNGTKSGLMKRLSDQEDAVIKMKAELLRLGFAQQSIETKKKKVPTATLR